MRGIGAKHILARLAHIHEQPALPPTRIHPGRALGLVEGVEDGKLALLQHRIPALTVEVEPPRRRRPIRRLAIGNPRRQAPRLIMIGDHLQPRRQHIARLMVEADNRPLAQMIQQGFHMLMEQPRPMLHARVPPPRRNRHIKRVIRRRRAEQFAIPLAKPRNAIPVQKHLAHRAQGQRMKIGARTLRRRVKGPHGINLIAEHVDANRLSLTGRKQINNPAPHSIFAIFHDGARAVVTIGLQKPDNRRGIHPPAALERQGAAGKHCPGRHFLHQRIDGGEQNPRPGGGHGQLRQRGHPLGHNLRIGRNPVIRQAIPGWEAQHLRLGHEEGQPLLQPGHAAIIARHMHNRPGTLGAAGAQQGGIHPLRRAINRQHALGMPAPGSAHSAAMRASMGQAWLSGMGRRPVSQSVRSVSW